MLEGSSYAVLVSNTATATLLKPHEKAWESRMSQSDQNGKVRLSVQLSDPRWIKCSMDVDYQVYIAGLMQQPRDIERLF